jgi:iron complex outermembrane receptor protein
MTAHAQRFRRDTAGRFLRAKLYASVIAAFAWTTHPALAQNEMEDASADGRRALEEVFVTATKTGARNIADVPAAITAFEGDTLQKRGIEGLGDIQGAAPNISMGRATNSAILTIRGIGSSNIFIGSDPSSVVHVDGIYIARPNMVLGDFVDMERIEILRGPQGTLYGRNAVGGTVNLITRKPSEEFRLDLNAEYGSYDLTRFSGAVGGGIIDGKLSGSLSALYSERDGYVDNVAANVGDLVDEDIQAVRGALRFTPTDRLTIDLSADYISTGNTGPTYKPTYANVDGSTPAIPIQVIDDFWTVNIPEEQINEIDNTGYTATITWDISDEITVTSLTGYRELEQEWVIDPDFSEFDEWLQSFWDEQEQFSQEINISGSTGRFDWVAGVYYFKEEIDFDLAFQPRFLWGAIPGIQVFIDSDLEAEAYAFFAQTDIEITDRLSATVGARYNNEEKTFNTFGRAFVPPDGAIIPIPGYPFARDNDSESWNAFTPKFGLDYDLSDDMMVYASATRGFKSGGYNITGTEPAYDPEYIWAYEVGFKAALLDGLAQFNSSAFYYDYQDLQVQSFTPQGTLDITNAADSEIIGIEFEVTASPVEGMQLYVAGSYLDATYDEYTTARATAPDVPVDLSGNRLNFAPEFMFTVAGEYRFPITSGLDASVQADLRWQDQTYFSAFNDVNFGQSSYSLVNAQFSLIPAGEHWTFSVYGRNLADEEYTVGAYDFSATGVANFIPEPRVFGLRVQYSH